MNPLDFRSDTVTRPTAGMRRAMAAAEVGDDVFGDDPTVLRLQEQIAARLGKEAALFVPSGTMSNLLGLMVHAAPGDELLCEAGCHIFNHEQGGYAQLGGLAVRPVAGDRGVLRVEDLDPLVRPANDHFVRTRLLVLENTHNRAGGRVQPLDAVADVCRWAAARGLARHLDGARLFNAAIAAGVPAARWADHFDTVSVCFSKGLGAPVGSALCGPRELIAAARRKRKVLGGGMRQAGVLAAAAVYALEYHVDRLAEDHARAKRLAAAIAATAGLSLTIEVETNIVFFQVQGPRAADFSAALRHQGLWINADGPRTLRALTHLDVGDAEVDAAIAILRRVAGELAAR